eukprot:733984-Alexandrium_andersonii.AAC.1
MSVELHRRSVHVRVCKLDCLPHWGHRESAVDRSQPLVFYVRTIANTDMLADSMCLRIDALKLRNSHTLEVVHCTAFRCHECRQRFRGSMQGFPRRLNSDDIFTASKLRRLRTSALGALPDRPITH